MVVNCSIKIQKFNLYQVIEQLIVKSRIQLEV